MNNKPPKPKPWRKWAIIFICWTAFGLFFTSQGLIYQVRMNEKLEWMRTVVTCMLWGYSWNLVTPLILCFLDRVPLQRGRLTRSIVLHFLAAAFVFAVTLAIGVVGYRLVLGPSHDGKSIFEVYRILLGAEFLPGLVIYWMVIGIYQAIDYYRKYRERELHASNLEARLIQAQLDALRMQLHPHFLFNTLNSISVLMRRDLEAADRMLLQLSNLLRVTLARNAVHEIKLRQELEILEGYLEIEQIRFQDRLTVRMEIDPSALDAMVPQLFFQPLVENAIRHGIANREKGGAIDIHAKRLDGQIHLQVRDNGPGLKPSPGDLIEGVGLSNTRSRLDYLYGSESRFEVYNAETGGLIVAAALPFHTETTIEIEAKG